MKSRVLRKISDFVISKRLFIILIFAAAAVYCALSVGKVRINNDITSLLPERTDTRRGLTVMNEEFVSYAGAEIMVSGVTADRASELTAGISSVDGVFSASFDPAEGYKDGNALISVMFDGEATDERAVSALNEVRALLADDESVISTEVGSVYLEQFAEEVFHVLLVSVAVIIIVLLFTSRSFFEGVVFIIVLTVSVILNMGTNYWFGEISTVTNSVAVILQLALSIDYAIIFCHRFQDEYTACGDAREALGTAHVRSVVEISSSGLTTVSGLVALTLMQFKLGYDLGTVLIKSIICTMLTVFLLMPGLILIFRKPILRTRHKSFVPSVARWGGFLSKGKPIFLILFVIMLPCVIYMSSRCDYTFNAEGTDRIRLSERDVVNDKIRTVFPRNTAIAVIVPGGDYEAEREVAEEVSSLPGIRSSFGLASVEAAEGVYLTDSVTPAQFSEMSGAGSELSEKVFKYYNLLYGKGGASDGSASAPLVDILLFIFGAVDSGAVKLEPEQSAMIDAVRGQIEGALKQLKGEHYSRMVFTADVPVESEAALTLVDLINGIVKEKCGKESLVIGDITSARDLRESFRSDYLLVTVLTIVFVFIVLFFAFRSFGASVLLILVIQGSIWLNFSFPFMTGTNLFFITYLIVSAIQMGATIDYAIVVYNHYRAAKELLPPKEAMAKAVNDSFPTIITSGVIMSAAGFLCGFVTTDLYVGSIGLAVGRGALTSVLLVLTALPQVILYGDKLIEKTTVRFRRK